MTSTTRTLLYACCVVPLLILVGCSHTHQFDPNPDVGTLEKSKLSGRTLALDLSGVPETFTDRASGHSFTLTGIRANADNMTRKFFARERFVDDPAKADYLLKLKLTIQIRSAFMGTSCEVSTQWDILRGGKVVSTGTGNDSASFPTVGAAGGNCEIASIKAISGGLDNAMAKL